MTMRPDPTFHASPKLAMEAPPESFAYTLLLSPDFSKPDALAVIANVRISDIAEIDCHVRFVPHACEHWVEVQRLLCRPSARPVAEGLYQVAINCARQRRNVMPVFFALVSLQALPWEYINDKIERRVLAGNQGMIVWLEGQGGRTCCSA
ncbi:MAG: hypothetical protein WA728_01730 [Xanthobacteraceae bacterium]